MPTQKNSQESFIKKTIYLKKTDSTNAFAKKHDFTENTLIIADCQTSGKGRTGKVWVSPAGSGIYMSFVLFPQVNVNEIMQFTLICGMAVCEALSAICGENFRIKWPNDIVFGGKKVCGILTECVCAGEKVKKCISGVGINVNTTDFPDEIKDIATSLSEICGKNFSREEIIRKITDIFEKYYILLVYKKDIKKIIEKYKSLCINIGKKVSANGTQTFFGTATDISEKGELVITDENGIKFFVNSGEVSLRGENGYV